MQSNFQLDQAVAIVAGDAYCDLHNCYDFVGFEYRPTEKKIRMEWQRGLGDWVEKALPWKLFLSFEGVTNLAVERKSSMYPQDSCVASIAFLPPALAKNFEAIGTNNRYDDEHLSIAFQSGSGIKVWAESVTYETRGA